MAKKIAKALIIDDDEISNFITTSILEQSNHVQDVDVVMSADEGIEYLQKQIKEDLTIPTLILLDIKMPVKSGWDFLEDFKKLNSNKLNNVKIVMLSSSVYPDDVHKAQTYSEVSGYLFKPITLEKVEEIMEKYLHK